ncbi:hypothetical protein [Pseudomonas viridiflava]|uniref:hypothetical protein n=1 Tax=Pseudomonas viridiflava TaxID=33069 RepID=UPI000F015DF2|nr:hypothetical protein [Pseudomonas viridiflava]
MNNRIPKGDGPFIDSYSIGFQLYRPDELNWKSRTIAGISWNGLEQEAIFFNADGLALPLRPNPWNVPEWIRKHAIRREFASVHGTGHFAMKEGRRNALRTVGLNDWVTYWLVDQSGGFANESKFWQEYVATDLATEQANSEKLHSEMRLQEDRATYIEQSISERRDYLKVMHRRRCNEDRKILAWLRGEVPAPLFDTETKVA